MRDAAQRASRAHDLIGHPSCGVVCNQDKSIVSVEAVTRRLLWRRLPSQLWSKLFHVSPPQVALGITAIQLWVIPRLVTTWPAVAQAMGTKLSFAGIDAQTEAARSEAVTMTVLSVCSVMSAFVAIVRTYSDLDVSFAAASRIMNMVDAMDACEAMNRKHATQAAGVLRRGTAVAVSLNAVTFADPTGTVLARNVNLHLQQGQRLLITGPRCVDAQWCHVRACAVRRMRLTRTCRSPFQWQRQDIAAPCPGWVVAVAVRDSRTTVDRRLLRA